MFLNPSRFTGISRRRKRSMGEISTWTSWMWGEIHTRALEIKYPQISANSIKFRSILRALASQKKKWIPLNQFDVYFKKIYILLLYHHFSSLFVHQGLFRLFFHWSMPVRFHHRFTGLVKWQGPVAAATGKCCSQFWWPCIIFIAR